MSTSESDEESSGNEVISTSFYIENVNMSAARDWCVMSTINPPPRTLRFYFISASALNFRRVHGTFELIVISFYYKIYLTVLYFLWLRKSG